ncbi:MAG TPA: isocitrate lyase/PEP mutase family protein [Pseudolabrys sp.]|jgi:methylisocitrate lyase
MSKAENNRKTLRARLASGQTLVVPGAHDPLSAMLVERAGFEAVYIGSYATAAAGFGLPDVGLVTMEEMAGYAKRIADAVDLPVIADGENGWNNAANIWRTVRAFEQAGVCGIHLEDHEFGKHADVPQVLLPCEQMVQKIGAACDARQDANFLIIARTDAAWAFNDIEDAIARMNAFSAAGADLVMPVGIGPKRLAGLRARIKGKVVTTDTPGRSVADEEAAGVDVVLYYGFSLMAAYHGVKTALGDFKRTRNAEDIAAVRGSVAEFENFIGYPEFAARAKKYGLA